MGKGRISCKNTFIAYKEGDKFIGTADEVAKHIGSKSSYIRKVSLGGYIHGYFIKQITTIAIIYCIDLPSGEHYESENESDLKEFVWYAPKTIARYCYQNFVLKDGTKFYCRREAKDFETAIERTYY